MLVVWKWQPSKHWQESAWRLALPIATLQALPVEQLFQKDNPLSALLAALGGLLFQRDNSLRTLQVLPVECLQGCHFRTVYVMAHAIKLHGILENAVSGK